ncbi:MAG: MerR family transcriptional regulator [Alloprevotella sp.]
MSYHTKFKIGEFSQFMQVTVKTLRHYEQKGLLVPDETDPWTGYRYYSLAQMQKLASIRTLQRLGFSLDEIKDLYEESEHVPSIVQIDDKIRSTEAQIAQLEMRLRRLLLLRDSRKEIKTMKNFTIQPLPEIIVASHRETIPDYAALGPLCYEKIGPEMQRLGCKCPTPGYCFTIDHNKEYRLTDIDIEYCEQVEEMLPDTAFIQFKRLPEVPKALILKHVGPYERFCESFTEAVRYMEEHGLQMAGHPRFSYIDGIWNQEDPEKWVSFIQIPLE